VIRETATTGTPPILCECTFHVYHHILSITCDEHDGPFWGSSKHPMTRWGAAGAECQAKCSLITSEQFTVGNSVITECHGNSMRQAPHLRYPSPSPVRTRTHTRTHTRAHTHRFKRHIRNSWQRRAHRAMHTELQQHLPSTTLLVLCVDAAGAPGLCVHTPACLALRL
jgi:hypothetical protein